MDENIFNKAFSRATELMNDEHFNRIVESKANAYSKGGNKSNNTVNEFSSFESAAFGAPQITENKVVTNNSVLPDAIRESFEKQPPIINEQTVIDSRIPMPSIPKQRVESYSTQTLAHTNNGIDYSLIRMIVDECVSNKLKEFTNNMLNESTNSIRGFKFADGNKIQFIDSKGNLYEGELKLKRKKK